MGKSKQSGKNIRAKRHFKQISDVSSTDQEMTDVDARAASQKITSKTSFFVTGGNRSEGLVGNVAHVIVVLARLAKNFFRGR